MQNGGKGGDSAVKKWITYAVLLAAWLFLALVYFPFLLAVPLGIRYFTHMLQLSSYQNPGYFRFLKKHFFHHVPQWIIAFALHLLWLERVSATGDAGYRFILPAILYAVVLTFYYRPRKEKKKFVATPRVRRLFVTITLLFYAAWGLSYLLMPLWLALWMTEGLATALVPLAVTYACMGLLPFTVALANRLNAPVEKAINNGFIRDAVRILKEQPRLRIIGITGSYGKTSVKHYLTTLLSEQFNVLMTPESYNTPMGIVRTIREQMKPVHEIFVCEMGARHVGDIKEITDFVRPDDGVLTAIGEQHMETFFTQENIVKTKYELLDAVEEKTPAAGDARAASDMPDVAASKAEPMPGTAPAGLKFVNGDNALIRTNMKYPEAITYGLDEGNDFRATGLHVTSDGTTFKIQLSEKIAAHLKERPGYAFGDGIAAASDRSPKEAADAGEADGKTTGSAGEAGTVFHTILVGAHNIQNITGAIAVAVMYGIPASKIRMGVRRIGAVPHRLELKKHGKVTILDDAFNSNPAGAKAALETLAMFRDAVKVLVTPGMVELGEREDALNAAFGAQAAAVCDYIILVGEKQTTAVKKGVLENGFDEDRLFVRTNFNDASRLMYELDAGREKVILLENDLPDNY